MAYLISAHLLKRRPDSTQLRAALPSSIGFALYQHETHAVFAIDTYRAGKPSRYPFSAATPGTDLSLDVPAELNKIHEQLRADNAANGLKRSYINLCRVLSTATRQEVLSVYSDDDGNDFACVCRDGEVLSGVARCEARVVKFGGSGASMSPAPGETRLHQLASEAVSSFLGAPASAFGFGSFDPPENYGFKLAAPDKE